MAEVASVSGKIKGVTLVLPDRVTPLIGYGGLENV